MSNPSDNPTLPNFELVVAITPVGGTKTDAVYYQLTQADFSPDKIIAPGPWKELVEVDVQMAHAAWPASDPRRAGNKAASSAKIFGTYLANMASFAK